MLVVEERRVLIWNANTCKSAAFVLTYVNGFNRVGGLLDTSFPWRRQNYHRQQTVTSRPIGGFIRRDLNVAGSVGTLWMCRFHSSAHRTLWLIRLSDISGTTFCRCRVMFFFFFLLLCAPLRSGGHRDLRTLKALLCAWPSFCWNFSAWSAGSFSQELMLALCLNVGGKNEHISCSDFNEQHWVGKYREKQYFNEKQLLAVLCTLRFNFYCPPRMFTVSVTTGN